MGRKLKVLIADDEELICGLLKAIINWKELGLQLAGEYNNGAELLDAMRNLRPDIVVTDISMPCMDGIDVIRSAREEGISCKFIVVSGCRQFEYAHTALKYDVDDYILKPIDEQEINDALSKIIACLQPQADKAYTLPAVTESEQRLRSFFLSRVIYEMEKSPLDYGEIWEQFGISFRDGLFQVVELKLDYQTDPGDTALEIGSLGNKLDTLFKQILGPCCFELVAMKTQTEMCYALNYPDWDSRAIQESIAEFFKQARHYIELFKGMRLTVCAGNAFADTCELSVSRNQAERAAYARIALGTDRIIHYDLLNTGEDIQNVNIESKLETFQKSIISLDKDMFRQQLEKLFEQEFSAGDCHVLIDLLNKVQEDFIRTHQNLLDEIMNEDHIRKQVYFAVRNAFSFSMLLEAYGEAMYKAFESLCRQASAKNSLPIRMAIQLIEQSYSKALRLEDAACLVGLSPVYFSQIFKKETGENFSNYIISHRMAVAKKLLAGSGYNINEISVMVGYSDSRHFSKLFKKFVGIKPTEYRKIYG